MIQPKYSPQEALERVKLMMKYDSSKTLNENKGIIKEQNNSPEGDVYTIKIELDKFNSDEQKIIDIVKKYNNKSQFQNFLNKYKTTTGKDFGKDVYRAINPNVDPTEWNDLKSHLSSFGITLGTAVDSQGIGGATFQGLSVQEKPIDPKKRGSTQIKSSKFKPCKGIYSKGCETNPSGAIGQVQSCLGLVADGKYGEKTDGKLKGIGYNSFKDADIQTICGKQKQPDTSKEESTPEIGGEVITVDTTNTDF